MHSMKKIYALAYSIFNWFKRLALSEKMRKLDAHESFRYIYEEFTNRTKIDYST